MGSPSVLAAFFQSLGIATLVAVAFEWSLRYCPTKSCKQFAASGIFSAGIILAMMNPVQLQPGLVFDLRHALLVIAPSFGGLPAAAATCITAMVARLSIGGIGAPAGLAGIAISTGVGLLIAHHFPRNPIGARKLAALAIGVSLSLLSLVLLPGGLAWTVVETVALPIVAANAVGVATVALLLNRQKSHVDHERELADRANRDPLTGLGNRHALYTVGPDILKQSLGQGSWCAFLVVDLDHFKSINDTFGHGAGDEVLRTIGSQIRTTTRPGDLVVRIGGEEFALVIPNLDREAAAALAEQIRRAIESYVYDLQGLSIKVTSSVGVYATRRSTTCVEEGLRYADEAMYKAKEAGRNRIVLANAA